MTFRCRVLPTYLLLAIAPLYTRKPPMTSTCHPKAESSRIIDSFDSSMSQPFAAVVLPAALPTASMTKCRRGNYHTRYAYDNMSPVRRPNGFHVTLSTCMSLFLLHYYYHSHGDLLARSTRERRGRYCSSKVRVAATTTRSVYSH